MTAQLRKITEYDIFKKTLFFHFSVKYEFGAKRCSTCIRPVFMKRFFFFLLKIGHFLGFHAFLNKKKLKGKFSDNLGQNTYRLFHFLAQFVLTTSETELDYYH